MLTDIITKVHALIGDAPAAKSTEVFTYESGDQVFVLGESNIVAITTVTINGSAVGSGSYDYDSTTGKITIVPVLSSADIIQVDYTYQNYSDTEITEYIRSALVYVSIHSANSVTDYELDGSDIYPTMPNKTEDLVALIAAIIIKPNHSRYVISNLAVYYPRTMAKDEKISRLVAKFNSGIGVTTLLTFNS